MKYSFLFFVIIIIFFLIFYLWLVGITNIHYIYFKYKLT